MAELPVAAVLGLGPVGRAVTLALRRTGRYQRVVAWDPDFDVARAAQRDAIADRQVNRAEEAAQGASVVFLALSGQTLRAVLERLGPELASGTVVCSLSEAQEVAQQVAQSLLPAHVSFICADPILWSTPPSKRLAIGQPDRAWRGAPASVETGQAPEGSESALSGGLWCVSPSPNAHETAVAYVAHVGELLGMRPYFLDAREHDALVAGTRHLPAVLAAALFQLAAGQPSWRELARVAGVEFSEVTAILAPPTTQATPAEKATAADLAQAEQRQRAQQDALAGHREHLVRWLDLLIADLTRLRDGLHDGREPADYFTTAANARATWLKQRAQPPDAEEGPQIEVPRRRFPF